MDVVAAFADWFSRTLGLDAATLGRRSVERIVAAALKRSGAADAEAYLALLAASPDEAERFVEALLVPETWFFRDGEPFVFLRRHLETAWLTARPDRPLRVLSAPCSTGEEPYSIAITLLEAGLTAADFTLEAADISRRALDFAGEALYGRASFRQPLDRAQEAFFAPAGRGHRLVPAASRTVRFRRANLVAPDFFAGEPPFDVIFCRNVFIYLTPAARQQLLANLSRLLAPEGLLFTGHAEMGILQQQGFAAIAHPRAFVCRRRAALPPRPPAAGRGVANPLPAVVAPAVPPAKRGRPAAAAAGEGENPAGHIPALHGRALALADQGRFAEAEALCRESLSRERPRADVYCLLGLIHEGARRSAEAEACYLRALYLDPDHHESLIHLGLLYRRQGKERKAGIYIRRAAAQERRADGTDRP